MTDSSRNWRDVGSQVNNHFNLERHLHNRETYKLNRSIVLTEWRQLAV